MPQFPTPSFPFAPPILDSHLPGLASAVGLFFPSLLPFGRVRQTPPFFIETYFVPSSVIVKMVEPQLTKGDGQSVGHHAGSS
jgi:hypothetical protein